MNDVRDSWRTERLNAAVYDSVVERRRIARVGGRLLWGTDTRLLFAAIDRLGEIPDGSDVLDLPCGGGLALRGLRPGQSIRYVAADISPFMLERARGRADKLGLEWVEFAEADALELPFASGEFDLCVSFNGLHCLPEQAPALGEMGRVLRPGGELRGTCVVAGAGGRQDRAIAGMKRISAFGEVSSALELTGLLGQAGFTGVEVEADGALAHFSARRPTS